MADFSVTFPKIDSKLSVSVLDINSEYAINDIPTLWIRLKSSISDKETFSLLNEASLKIGSDITVKGGEVEIFKGIITAQSIGKDREAFIELGACNKLFKLTQGQVSILFKKTPKDEEIVKKLVDDAKVDLKIGDKSLSKIMHPHYFCYQQSPWRVIMSRVFENGALLVPGVKANNLINADATARPEKTINMDMSGVTAFLLGTDLRSKFSGVTAKAWDVAKQDFEKKDSKPLSNLKLLSDEKSILDSKKLVLISNNALVSKQIEGIAQAQQIYRELDNKQGSMSFDLSNIKDAEKKILLSIELLDRVKLKGVDNKKTEGYVVSSIRHRNEGSRWIMDLEFGLSLSRSVDSDFFSLSPLPNLIGKVSKYDPENDKSKGGYNQVPVIFKMFDLQEPINIRPMSLFASKKEGILFQPNQDDEVVVGFIDGDCRSPVVLGYCHNKMHAPPESFSAETPARGLFFDKSGDGTPEEKLGIQFDSKKPEIEIYLGKNDKLSMTEEKGIKLAREKESISLFKDVDILSEGKINITNKGEHITVKTQANLVIDATETEIK